MSRSKFAHLDNANMQDQTTNDAGFVLVTVSLLFVILLAFIGYSVDLGRVNAERNSAQAAAEAAALGGVAFLPDDFPQAESTARQVAALHGYTTGVQVTQGIGGNRLIVEIGDTVDHYFISLLGNADTQVSGRAEAEFQPQLELGSPDLTIGNDPEGSGPQPNYWLSIAGTEATKDLGDRFMPYPCGDNITAGCSNGGGNFYNNEQENRGYNFAIPIDTPGENIRIQVFDPSWVWTGGKCSLPYFPDAAEIGTLQLADGVQVPAGYYADAATRYAAGETEWCTGDDLPGWTGSDIRFTVRLPDDTPWDDFDNPTVVCDETFAGYEPKSDFTDHWQPTIFEMLDPLSGLNEWQVDPNDGRYTFAEVFRRWVTICEVTVPIAGDLIVQARTLGGEGQNRFSLRAGPPNGVNGVADVGQSTYARGRLPIYVNSVSTTTVFKPIRIPPAASDRVLRVTFFDIGDADESGTLRIRPPADSNMASFPNCEFRRSNSSTPLLSNGDCSISGVLDTNGYDGQVVTASVPIPDDYSCPAGPDNCWITVEATFTGGITDATTWTARIDGDAVRIVG